MDVIAKLNKMRLERDLSVYRLAELSGINQSTLANTFSRGTVPSIKKPRMYVRDVGGKSFAVFAEDEAPMALTPGEAKLVKNFRKLPENLKRSVADIINAIPDLRV